MMTKLVMMVMMVMMMIKYWHQHNNDKENDNGGNENATTKAAAETIATTMMMMLNISFTTTETTIWCPWITTIPHTLSESSTLQNLYYDDSYEIWYITAYQVLPYSSATASPAEPRFGGVMGSHRQPLSKHPAYKNACDDVIDNILLSHEFGSCYLSSCILYPFCYHGWLSVPTWISNYIPSNV